MFIRILNAKEGNFSALFALTLPVLLVSAGMAVDVARLTSAKYSLQNGVDAALIAASRFKDENGSREKFFDDFLAAALLNEPALYNVSSDFNAVVGIDDITTTATASGTIDLTFMPVLGHEGSVSVSATAYESTDALEVVMVLDNTGSMAGSRISALRTAAGSLVDIVEEAAEANPERSIRLALVPFVTGVNIGGEEFDWDWIDQNAQSQYHGANFDLALDHGWTDEYKHYSDDEKGKSRGTRYKKRDEQYNIPQKTNHLALFARLETDWKGCVEARPRTVGVDTAPDIYNPDTLFVPYFAPDEPDKDFHNASKVTPSTGNDGAILNNSYLPDDFSPADYNTPAGNLSIQKSIGKYRVDNTPVKIDGVGPLTGGPNRACPTPVVPLTDDFAKLKTAVNGMIEWNGSGTNVSEGLAWGTRVLSPGEPYTTGAPFDGAVSKVVVLLTDGENVVFGSSKTFNKSDYGAYGFLSSNRFGSTSQSTAATNVDSWTKANCTWLKNEGVRIITVVLQADTTNNRKLYGHANGGCASSPEDYYPTNDVTKLKDVFEAIARKIAPLHLVH